MTGCGACKTERKSRVNLQSPAFPADFPCPHPGSGPVPSFPQRYTGDRTCPECGILTAVEVVMEGPGTVGYRCGRGHEWAALTGGVHPASLVEATH